MQQFIGVEEGRNQKIINVSPLVKGSYTVRLEIAKQANEVAKFIKKHY